MQIETFDPHEPFFSHQQYKDLYPHDYDGPHFDWPDYKRVVETDGQVRARAVRVRGAAVHVRPLAGPGPGHHGRTAICGTTRC